MIRSQSVAAQVLRYGLVGGVVLACDFATYAGLLALFPGGWLGANGGGKLVGAAVGFVLHRHFTFSWEQRDGAGRQALSYVGLFLANLALSSALLGLLVDGLGANAYAAKVGVDGIVVVTAFLASRFWVYRARAGA